MFLEGTFVKLKSKKHKLSNVQLTIIGVYDKFYNVEFVQNNKKKTAIFSEDQLEKY